ncbi:hypothetical protein NEOLEDRAFT_1145923 [Neolentinus lepideus HHB14362 ss-1]|uniref:Uncharacterized protein n=1 Tax=Neolentinus lepideus HHB14362 ss-1 TaxID=1314782 RepID=A0A165UKQ3_9AGAM|nr:hypothetical protein NEOLEDRAFT_1145923 [Neolentinus lepideus HHB14362 ss-1]
MGDLLSLSVVLISVFSFITSLLAIVVRVGFSHPPPFSLSSEAGQPHHESPMSQAMAQVDKLWNWSASLGLPFNINGGSGMSGMSDAGMGIGMGYTGGAQLVRMNVNWHVPRKFGEKPPPPPPYVDVQAPLSMAKIIMSRHHRRPNRPPRRLPGMSPPQSRHSRLVESFV